MKAPILFATLLIIAFVACSSSPGGLKLPAYSTVQVGEYILSDIEIEEMREIFSSLKQSSYEFIEKPDLQIRGFRNANDSHPDLYSIFLAEGFIFVGDYFEAWANSFKGQKSACYVLNREAKEFLESF
ncbi:MAG: hypothetical protein JW784_03125 [Candidatus Cloacimonetes bacterium]|nr:hypothetical protein [Candidatus Cloacimonadota bacterium]